MRYVLNKARKEGFTLIELMIVVAIVGVLAVLAVYGVRKYIANAKTAEARNSLGQIGKDAATAYEKESMANTVITQGNSTALARAMCISGTNPIPNGATNIQGKKYQSTPAEWSVDSATAGKGFACLKYSMDQPQYYMYTYATTGSSATGDTFTATANGDLDGNGTTSAFTLKGAIGSGFVLNIAPQIGEVSPEE